MLMGVAAETIVSTFGNVASCAQFYQSAILFQLHGGSHCVDMLRRAAAGQTPFSGRLVKAVIAVTFAGPVSH
jgi:hypothetical protein